MADAPNLNAITDLTTNQRAGTNQLLAGQNQQQQDFLGGLKGYVASQPTSQALADRIGTELNLPNLQANSQSLNQTLFNLPQTYSKATTGFDVNQNQLDRVVGTKQAELAPAAALASQNTLNAQQQQTQRMGYAEQDFQHGLIPYTSAQSLMSERQAREVSAYTQENQQELDGLIQKSQMGVQMSEGDKNRMNALAVAEANFQHQMDLQKQAQGAQGPQTQIIDVGGQKKLINTQTGQVIQTLGSTGTGSSAPSNSYYATPAANPFTAPSAGISPQGNYGSFNYSAYGL